LLQGLPVIHVQNMGRPGPAALVKTSQNIPLVCGSTPLEYLDVICNEIDAAVRPVECATVAGKCSVFENSTRLPACKAGAQAQAQAQAQASAASEHK
jgi:hypothetical protein